MRQAADNNAFVQDPVGMWTSAGTSLGWCHSPALCGAVVWGRPDVGQVHQAVGLFEAFRHPSLAPRIVLVLDARSLDVEMEAFQVLAQWLRARRAELRQRVALQVGIVGGGISALTISGILPLVGDHHPFKVFSDAHAAYVHASQEHGAALHDEVNALVGEVQRLSHDIAALQVLMRQKAGRPEIDTAARQLGMSRRSLQRQLAAAGTSFRAVQQESRYAAAIDMLENTDLKVASIASRLEISERALAALLRSHGGTTPSEYRTRSRSKM